VIGLLHPKNYILSYFTRLYVVPNLFEFFSSAELGRYFEGFFFNQTVDGNN